MDVESGPIETPHSTPGRRKRSTPGGDPDPPQRAKRGKYSSAACVECKKRKLKCSRIGRAKCERCITHDLACVYVPNLRRRVREDYDDQSLQILSDDMFQLRRQVESLAGIVQDLKDKVHESQARSSRSRDNAATQSPSSTHHDHVPKQPQFIGPTRSAFGIMVGERSLSLMGIPTFEPIPPSGVQSPPSSVRITEDSEFWDSCTANEITKLLVVFQEEVQPAYPLVDISDYLLRSEDILQAFRRSNSFNNEIFNEYSKHFEMQDLDIVKVAIAIGIAVEMHGKNDLSTAIVEPVERNVSRLLRPKADLREIQLLALLGIYYFHCDEELLAWRAVGLAAREALELGLHRKQSLFDNFRDPDLRHLAVRVFWCVYVLDRRWSFGTSLSFALVDTDIDSELPDPGPDFQFLKYSVDYARLSSKVWDAIPPFGSAPQSIPDEKAIALDNCAKDWLQSIPSHLKLRHPSSSSTPGCQRRMLQQQRTLLYLRGNYIRILIHRQYLMSPGVISSNSEKAWTAVDVAHDTIRVLAHLHATSDIYLRQENVFNYFLLSAMAIIFLAVCHAPATFAVPCRKSFYQGVELVRGMSDRHRLVSSRLWNTIHGLIPRMRTLSLRHVKREQLDGETAISKRSPLDSSAFNPSDAHGADDASVSGRVPEPVPESNDFPLSEIMLPSLDLIDPIPNMIQIRDGLLGLFDAFEQGQHMLLEGYEESDYFNEISQAFQGLI